jgi:hypothetical protein
MYLLLLSHGCHHAAAHMGTFTGCQQKLRHRALLCCGLWTIWRGSGRTASALPPAVAASAAAATAATGA